MNYLKLMKHGIEIGGKYLTKNAPTILSSFGVVMMCGATVKGIIEAPKARDELANLDDDPDISHNEYLKKKARIIFYHYWMTGALMLGGAGMIFWSDRLSLAKTAAAIAAYNMKSEDLAKLEKKLADEDGEKHLDNLKSEIVQDTIKSNSWDESQIIKTGKGNSLFYDVACGRPFYSDLEWIRQQTNKLNADINKSVRHDEDTDIPLNDWYDAVRLPRTQIGNKLGWHNQIIELKVIPAKTPDDIPCLGIGFHNSPIWDFDEIDILDERICSDDWCDRVPYEMRSD